MFGVLSSQRCRREDRGAAVRGLCFGADAVGGGATIKTWPGAGLIKTWPGAVSHAEPCKLGCSRVGHRLPWSRGGGCGSCGGLQPSRWFPPTFMWDPGTGPAEAFHCGILSPVKTIDNKENDEDEVSCVTCKKEETTKKTKRMKKAVPSSIFFVCIDDL